MAIRAIRPCLTTTWCVCICVYSRCLDGEENNYWVIVCYISEDLGQWAELMAKP